MAIFVPTRFKRLIFPSLLVFVLTLFVSSSTATRTPTPNNEHARHAIGVPVRDSTAQLAIMNRGTTEVKIGAPFAQVKFVSNQERNFRTNCKFTHHNYSDPLVFPGVNQATHLHTFFGNSSITGTVFPLRRDGSADTTRIRSVRAGSTCGGGTANLSAYWFPTMLDENNRVVPISNDDEHLIYYKSYADISVKVTTDVPLGFSMITGDAKNDQPGKGVATFQCHGSYQARPGDFQGDFFGTPYVEGAGGSIPICNGGSKMKVAYAFPSCWNGRQASDHKGHVAWGNSNGCPSSHPIRLPDISYIINYRIPQGTNSARWKLSSDMYTINNPNAIGGYSSHADWINGWDPALLRTWVTKCLNAPRQCYTDNLGDGRGLR